MSYTVYLDSEFSPVAKDAATLAKVVGDDGSVKFYHPTAGTPARRNTQKADTARNSMQSWGLTDEQANEKGTLRTLLVAKVHHAYTTACDQLSMRGYLSQEQRAKVTNAFGAALKFLNENLDAEVGAIRVADGDLSEIANTQKAARRTPSFIVMPHTDSIELSGTDRRDTDTS